MSIPLTQEIRDEIVRLRRDEHMTRPEICQRMGLCATTVQKLIKAYPLLDEHRREIARQAARKMRMAAVASGKLATYEEWCDVEDDQIRALYPTADKAEVLAALPRRGWKAIQNRASSINIHRPHARVFKKQEAGPLPIVAILIDRRKAMGWSARYVAKLVGVRLDTFSGWEAGEHSPRLEQLIAWASALGGELAAVAKGGVSRPFSALQEKIRPLSRDQLMARKAA